MDMEDMDMEDMDMVTVATEVTVVMDNTVPATRITMKEPDVTQATLQAADVWVVQTVHLRQ
jgi:uncharacterized protein YcfL